MKLRVKKFSGGGKPEPEDYYVTVPNNDSKKATLASKPTNTKANNSNNTSSGSLERIRKTITVDNDLKSDTTNIARITENGKWNLDSLSHTGSSLKGPDGEPLTYMHSYTISRPANYGTSSVDPEQFQEPNTSKVLYYDDTLKKIMQDLARLLLMARKGLVYLAVGDLAVGVGMTGLRAAAGPVSGTTTDYLDILFSGISNVGSDDYFETKKMWESLPEKEKQKWGSFTNWFWSNDTSGRAVGSNYLQDAKQSFETMRDDYRANKNRSFTLRLEVRGFVDSPDGPGGYLNIANGAINFMDQVWNNEPMRKSIEAETDLVKKTMKEGAAKGFNVANDVVGSVDWIYDVLSGGIAAKNNAVRAVKMDPTWFENWKNEHRAYAELYGLNIDDVLKW